MRVERRVYKGRLNTRVCKIKIGNGFPGYRKHLCERFRPGTRVLFFDVVEVAAIDSCPLSPFIFVQTCRFEQHKRSEEHTSELQSLMRISYAVFCLNKKKKKY